MSSYFGSSNSSNPEIAPKASTDAAYIPTNQNSLLLSLGLFSVEMRTGFHLSSKYPIGE